MWIAALDVHVVIEVAVWGLTLVLLLGGLAGVLIPLVPGTLLILVGATVHKLLLPGDLSWTSVGCIAGFWLLSMIADLAGVLVGTRWFGGSKWGVAGAGGGALVGVFFSLPALIFGTIFGAMAAEKFLAKRSGHESLLAGIGAATGFLISTVARLFCAVVMIALFFAAVLA